MRKIHGFLRFTKYLFYFPEFLLSFYPFVALQKFQFFSSFWFSAFFLFLVFFFNFSYFFFIFLALSDEGNSWFFAFHRYRPLFYFPEFLLSFYSFVALQKFQSFSSFWFLASFCFYSLGVYNISFCFFWVCFIILLVPFLGFFSTNLLGFYYLSIFNLLHFRSFIFLVFSFFLFLFFERNDAAWFAVFAFYFRLIFLGFSLIHF